MEGFKVKHKNTNTAEFMKEKHFFLVRLLETNKILPVKVEHKKYVVLRHYRYYFSVLFDKCICLKEKRKERKERRNENNKNEKKEYFYVMSSNRKCWLLIEGQSTTHTQ